MSTSPLEPIVLVRDSLLSTFGNGLDNSFAIDLLENAVVPSYLHMPRPFDEIDIPALMRSFMALDLLRRALDVSSSILSNRFSLTLNKLIGIAQQLSSSLESLSDSISVAEVYLSSSTANRRVYRLRPEATSPSRRDLPIGAVSIDKLQAASATTLKGVATDLASALNDTVDKFASISPEDGKSQIEIKLGTKSIINSLGINASEENGSPGKVSSVSAQMANGQWEKIAIPTGDMDRLINDIHIPVRATAAQKLRVEFEHSGKLVLSNLSFEKIIYNASGTITEQFVNVGEPVLAISVKEESAVWSDDRIQDYLSIRHEISLDGSTWETIAPINASRGLPELILINSPISLPGAINLMSVGSVKGFWYRASYDKKGEIPQYLLQEIVTAEKKTEKVLELAPSLGLQEELVLKATPVNHVLAVSILGAGRAAEDSTQGIRLGFSKQNSLVHIPNFVKNALDRREIVVMCGGNVLEEVASSPAGYQYSFADDKNILLSSSISDGLDIIVSHKPVKLNLKVLGGKYTALLPFQSDGAEGNSVLQCYDPPTQATATLTPIPAGPSGLYSARLPHHPILSISSLVDTLLTSLSPSSSFFATVKTYVSGKECVSLGDYSVNLVDGIIWFCAGTENPRLRRIECQYIHENMTKISLDEWNYSTDNSSIVIETMTSVSMTSTIDGGRSTSFPYPSTDTATSTRFSLIDGSVYVKDAVCVASDDFGFVHLTAAPVIFGSYVGNYYTGRPPFTPMDNSKLPTLNVGYIADYQTSTDQATSHGRWYTDNDLIYLYSTTAVSSGYLDYIYMSGYGGNAPQYYVDPINAGIVFDRNVSNKSIVYRMAAYDLQYNFSFPVAPSDFSFDAKTNKVTLNRSNGLDILSGLSPSVSLPTGLAVAYQRSLANELEKVDERFVTLLPKHVDLEVVLK